MVHIPVQDRAFARIGEELPGRGEAAAENAPVGRGDGAEGVEPGRQRNQAIRRRRGALNVQPREDVAEDPARLVVVADGGHLRQATVTQGAFQQDRRALMGQNPRGAVSGIPTHQRRASTLLLADGDLEHGRHAISEDRRKVVAEPAIEGLAVRDQPPGRHPRRQGRRGRSGGARHHVSMNRRRAPDRARGFIDFKPRMIQARVSAGSITASISRAWATLIALPRS